MTRLGLAPTMALTTWPLTKRFNVGRPAVSYTHLDVYKRQEDRSPLAAVVELLDQPAGDQGAQHTLDVDPTDRPDPGPRDRLEVGDDGQGLQRRLGQPRLCPCLLYTSRCV